MMLAVAFILILLCGCGINQQFVKTVEKYYNQTAQEHIDYINNDPTLNSDSKDERIRTIRKFRELIDTAKEE